MEEKEHQHLPASDKIIVWGIDHHYPADESLIPAGKEPQVFEGQTGMNMREVYVPEPAE